ARVGRRLCLLAVLAGAACSHRGPPRVDITTPQVAASPAAPTSTGVLDDFEALDPWRVEASDGVVARLSPVSGAEGRALKLDFDFRGHGGHAAARRSLPLVLPDNYELSFDLRGEGPPNDFQLKLADESGENVWWFRRADFEFPPAWQKIVIKKRHVEFAWGPTRARELQRAARIELVVAAGKGGGRGSITVDDLRIRALPVPPATPPRPVASASGALPGSAPELATDGLLESAWRAAPSKEQQRFQLDLGYEREFGGLILRWETGKHAAHYDVELSDDGVSWRVGGRVSGGDGGRDALRLPEAQARYLRVNLHSGPGDGYGLAEIEVKELAFGASQNAFLTALARESRRGDFPRAYLGEQPYWTLVGVDAAKDSALISEDGALEIGKGRFSVEPFVVMNGEVTSWAGVSTSHRLADGYLPLPTVTWHHPAWHLHVSAHVGNLGTGSELGARYELENRTSKSLDVQLVLAVRPLQVNPPTQSLNLAGGVSLIRSLDWNGSALSVNGEPVLFPLAPPQHVGLASFDGGGFPQQPPPASGRAPAHLEDDSGLASATLVHSLRIPPRRSAVLGLAAPLGVRTRPQTDSVAELERQRAAIAENWRGELNRVRFDVPEDGRALIETLRSSLAHILMSREGPILKPGTRSYARSWIRDGAMMSESLLRLGHAEAATEYLTWYAPYQFENGKVPCCVDARGADPVPENDSAGQFIFLAAEVHRFTKDRAKLETIWPAVEAAAGYMETLRQSERGPKNAAPERRAFYGLMPPSISHEGYSDKPAYSYWDDFWALIGYQDAAELAGVLQRNEARERIERQRDEFRKDLYASLRAAATQHGIRYLPGAADRGDFDATSTTIALAPGREGPHLPADLLIPTFERYYEEFVARRSGARNWDVYTPYELRVVGTFIRLGWRDRARELFEFFLKDRRPAGWNQWAEVVGRREREPRFIGDMPHAWIASDYIRSVLDSFAYVRHADSTLVLGAGVPPGWWTKDGFGVRELRTPYGPLSYSIEPRNGRLSVQISGATPPGGFALPWPFAGAPSSPATVNGKPVAWRDGELRFTGVPASVLFAPGAEPAHR
ncbi:MAG TPA: discoidin domain-containing protein, partial [Polyangiaceae bacterium]